MKKIIRAAWNGRFLDDKRLCKALLQYRNTPSAKDGLSPAQKLFGHPVQDTIPAHPRSFTSEWQKSAEEVESRREVTQQNAKRYYDQTAHPLPDIKQGSQVVLQNPTTRFWDTYAVVVSVDPHCKYRVKTKDGRVLIRNRKFLCRRVPTLCPPRVDTPIHQSPDKSLVQPRLEPPCHPQMYSFQDGPAGLAGNHKDWWRTLHGTNIF